MSMLRVCVMHDVVYGVAGTYAGDIASRYTSTRILNYAAGSRKLSVLMRCTQTFTRQACGDMIAEWEMELHWDFHANRERMCVPYTFSPTKIAEPNLTVPPHYDMAKRVQMPLNASDVNISIQREAILRKYEQQWMLPVITDMYRDIECVSSIHSYYMCSLEVKLWKYNQILWMSIEVSTCDVRRLLCGEYCEHRHYTQRQRIHTAMVMFVAATTSYLVKMKRSGQNTTNQLKD